MIQWCNVTVTQKIYLIAAVLIAAVIGISTLSLTTLNRVAHSIENFDTMLLPLMQAQGDLKVGMEQMGRSLNRFNEDRFQGKLSKENPYPEIYRQACDLFLTSLNKLRTIFTSMQADYPNHANELQTALKLLADMEVQFQERAKIGQIIMGNVDTADAEIARLTPDLTRLRSQMQTTNAAFFELFTSLTKNIDHEEIAWTHAVINKLLIIVIVVGVGAALLSYIVATGIKQNLAATSLAITALAEGKQDVEIGSETRADEFGIINRAMAIFKRNAIEKERLENEQRAAQQRALARAEHVQKLSTSFNGDIQ